jgi:hypothetical protein
MSRMSRLDKYLESLQRCNVDAGILTRNCSIIRDYLSWVDQREQVEKFIVFVDGMDANVYVGRDQLNEAIKCALDNGALRIDIEIRE